MTRRHLALKAIAALRDLQDSQPEWRSHRLMSRLLRDLALVADYDAGRVPLREVADSHGLTHQRVSQVLRSYGIGRGL